MKDDMVPITPDVLDSPVIYVDNATNEIIKEFLYADVLVMSTGECVVINDKQWCVTQSVLDMDNDKMYVYVLAVQNPWKLPQ